MANDWRALMSRPKFLILDEPSLGLAPLVVDGVCSRQSKFPWPKGDHIPCRAECLKSLGDTQRGYVLEHGSDLDPDSTSAALQRQK